MFISMVMLPYFQFPVAVSHLAVLIVGDGAKAPIFWKELRVECVALHIVRILIKDP
ncbi:hypothetical protein DFQ28_006909, partial [Apophysomyces sp. BC1034]